MLPAIFDDCILCMLVLSISCVWLMCLRSPVMPEGMFVSLDDCYYAQLVLLRNNLFALEVCTVCCSASIQILSLISHVMLMQVRST